MVKRVLHSHYLCPLCPRAFQRLPSGRLFVSVPDVLYWMFMETLWAFVRPAVVVTW